MQIIHLKNNIILKGIEHSSNYFNSLNILIWHHSLDGTFLANFIHPKFTKMKFLHTTFLHMTIISHFTSSISDIKVEHKLLSMNLLSSS